MGTFISEVVHIHCCIKKQSQERKTSRVYPDETFIYEPSHQDLHCLQRCMYWSAGMEGLRMVAIAYAVRPTGAQLTRQSKSLRRIDTISREITDK